MKIAFFELADQEKKNYFNVALAGHELTYFADCLTSEHLPEIDNFDIISVFVASPVTKQVINHFPNLKHISVRGTGFDNVDTNYAKEKGITVSNIPAYGSHTVAEFTFGLILSLSRKIPQAVNRLKIGADFNFEGLRGFDLHGKTLGVIGTGKIGTNVIKIAKGFEMNVLACDTYPNHELAKALGFNYVSLEKLLEHADIVSIHVPYMKATHHLINKENIGLMKKGALIINTARGAVIDTESLFQAITKEHIGGAGLDVLEEEAELKEEADLLSENRIPDKNFKKVLEEHILIGLPTVVVTPHMAFYSREAESSILETTVKNIKSALIDKPENIVNG